MGAGVVKGGGRNEIGGWWVMEIDGLVAFLIVLSIHYLGMALMLSVTGRCPIRGLPFYGLCFVSLDLGALVIAST